jgi:hypothetical protein
MEGINLPGAQYYMLGQYKYAQCSILLSLDSTNILAVQYYRLGQYKTSSMLNIRYHLSERYLSQLTHDLLSRHHNIAYLELHAEENPSQIPSH